VPEMPVYVQNQIGNIEQSIREISGQHEVSSSQVPAGVTAASAINLLQEQDDTRLGPDIADMETTLPTRGSASCGFWAATAPTGGRSRSPARTACGTSRRSRTS
jgi:hypothetical protein